MVGLDHSMVMSVELLSGILLWGGVGWLLDRWLGTAHWLFGIGVMLGFAAGLYLVWLRSGGAGAPTRAAPTTRGRGRDSGEG